MKWNEKKRRFSHQYVCGGYRLRVPRDCNRGICLGQAAILTHLRAVWPPSVTSKSSLWQHTKQCVIVLVSPSPSLSSITSMRLLIKREKEIIPSECRITLSGPTHHARTQNSSQFLMKTLVYRQILRKFIHYCKLLFNRPDIINTFSSTTRLCWWCQTVHKDVFLPLKLFIFHHQVSKRQ